MKRKIPSSIFAVLCILLTAAPVTAAESGLVTVSGVICSPWISGVLFAVAFSCILIELITTGFGFFGITGLFLFFLYFGAHIALDRFALVGLVVFAAGMAFLMLEAYVVSGSGFAGVLGICAIFGSVFLLSSSLQTGILTVTVAVILTILIMVVSYRFMAKKKIIHRFVLRDRTDTESGYTSPNMDNEKYLGAEGVTLTKLRPAGEMRIGEERVDVVSEGDFIDAGVKVRVIAIDGTRNIVRKIEF